MVDVFIVPYLHRSIGCECLQDDTCVALAWMPLGKLVAVTKGEVLLFGMRDRGVERLARRASDVSLDADFVDAVVNCTNGLLYVACSSGKILVFDAAAQLLATIDSPGNPSAIGLCGTRVVVGDIGGTIHIFDSVTMARERSLPFQDHVRAARCAGGSAAPYTAPITALTGTGDTLLVRSADSLLLALDLVKLRVAGFVLGHFGAVPCVAFDPANPHTFASGSTDQSVMLWTILGMRTATGLLDLPKAIDRRMSYLRRVWNQPSGPRGAVIPTAIVV